MALPAGVYAHPAGYAPLREAIARHIAVSRGVLASPDDIIITNGTQQALDVVARVLLAPGNRVAVEDPGYTPPRRLFESLGIRVSGVRVDREGILVDALPRHCRLAYVTPSHQFPLGMSMSLARRLALLAWADRQNAAIVEDDYDSEFRFRERPIEALQSLDARGRVIYVGSFSKTMLPTLRLGFVVAPPSLRDALHRAKYLTDWHTPLAFQAALAAFIDEGGFGRHVRRMSNIYRVRHEIIVETIRRDFADLLEVVPSIAGLHVCALAKGSEAPRIGAVLRDAAALGVVAQDLSRFAVGPDGPAGIMLGYGAVPTERIAEGLRRLRSAFD
jgi:GntR family transcriptional regulator/MocR family aminotransferase